MYRPPTDSKNNTLCVEEKKSLIFCKVGSASLEMKAWHYETQRVREGGLGERESEIYSEGGRMFSEGLINSVDVISGRE